MSTKIYRTCWAGSLVMAAALCGCVNSPRPATPPDTGPLLSLGPKVGTPKAAPSLQIAGPAPQTAPRPFGNDSDPAQTGKVVYGDPKTALGYAALQPGTQVSKLDPEAYGPPPVKTPGLGPVASLSAPPAPPGPPPAPPGTPTTPIKSPPTLPDLPPTPPEAAPDAGGQAPATILPTPQLPAIDVAQAAPGTDATPTPPAMPALPAKAPEQTNIPPAPPPVPDAPPEQPGSTPAPKAAITVQTDGQAGSNAPAANSAKPAPALPDTPPTPPAQIAFEQQSAPPQPAAPVQPATVAPQAPAPLAAQVKEQTEEPPPLAGARPLPMIGLQPVSKGTPGKAAGDLQTVHQLATESYASIDSYIVRFKRREQVAGKDMPEELMLFKFRKQPMSVYFKWLAGNAKGREAAYVQDKYGNKLHTVVAPGDIPLIPGGKKLSFAIDSTLVRSKSRHSVTEAGVGHSIEEFGNLVENMKQKDYRFGSLKYLGMVKRPEFEGPVEAVLQIIPPKVEPDLPKGGKRFWYFDTHLRFPVLLITFDDKNHEVEYYCYDRWLFPGRLSEDEFNPNVLWREN